jgi:hypothetical protein
MCYVVTSLHARISFLLAARSAFFSVLRVWVERFLLGCAGAHVFFVARAFSIFLPALERALFAACAFSILLTALHCLPVLEHAGTRTFSKA